jgi:hypothetical protein
MLQHEDLAVLRRPARAIRPRLVQAAVQAITQTAVQAAVLLEDQVRFQAVYRAVFQPDSPLSRLCRPHLHVLRATQVTLPQFRRLTFLRLFHPASRR